MNVGTSNYDWYFYSNNAAGNQEARGIQVRFGGHVFGYDLSEDLHPY